ncbi:MAG: hemerythrin family protein [Elusimicrobia bacterium]|nr:hemerythrin family protein [Elusimicrobiota bacterium]
MMPFQWNQFMATGIPAIDKQHKDIFQRINEFINAIMNENEQENIETLLNFLIAHATTMFGDEEKMLKEKNYPDFAVHKAQHEYFIRTIEALKRDFESGIPMDKLTADIHQRVCNWLTIHLSKTDMQWVAFLKTSTPAS